MTKRRVREKQRPSRETGNHAQRRHIDFDVLFPLLYVVLYVVVLLIVYLRYFPIGDTGVETDFYAEMAEAARELWKGNFSVTQYPYKGPAYSFALTALFALIGDWYRSGVFLNIIFSAAGIVLLYRLIRAVFNRPVAVFTTISVSLVFEFFLVAHKASSDMLFFFLFMLVLERIVTGRLSWSRLCIAAVAGGLAFLTRYNGIFIPACVLITLLVINPGALTLRRRILYSTVYLVVFLAACTPWFVASYRETGTLLYSRNLDNISWEFYGVEETPESEFSSLREIVSHDPLHFVTHYLGNIPRHFWNDMSGTIGIEAGILVMLGLLRMFIIPPTRRQYAFFAFALMHFLLLCFVFHLRRFSIAVTPAYYAIAFSLVFGSGVSERSRLGTVLHRALDAGLERMRGVWKTVIWEKKRKVAGAPAESGSRAGKKGKGKKRPRAGDRNGVSARAVPAPAFSVTLGQGLVFALIVFLVVFQVKRIVTHERMYYDRRPLFVMAAAQFLSQPEYRLRDGKRAVLMARKPHVAFYADMRFQHYPKSFHGLLNFISYALKNDVDYIVYSVIERMHYPEGTFLAILERTPGIEVIYKREEIFIYAIEDWINLSKEEGRATLRTYEANLNEAEMAGDTERALLECYNLSGIYGINGEWEKKAECHKRALRVIEALPDSSARMNHTVNLKCNISEAYLMLGSHREGIDILSGAMQEIERSGTVEQLISAHIILSKHYGELEQWEAAIRELSTVRDLYEQYGNMEKAEFARQQIEKLKENMQ